MCVVRYHSWQLLCVLSAVLTHSCQHVWCLLSLLKAVNMCAVHCNPSIMSCLLSGFKKWQLSCVLSADIHNRCYLCCQLSSLTSVTCVLFVIIPDSSYVCCQLSSLTVVSMCAVRCHYSQLSTCVLFAVIPNSCNSVQLSYVLLAVSNKSWHFQSDVTPYIFHVCCQLHP